VRASSSTEASWFIAFPFVHEVALRGLKPPPPAVRLFVVDDLHITLAFLGPCGEASARAAFASVAPSSMAPFTLGVGGAELFGGARRPTAIARRIEGEAERLIGSIAGARGPALEIAAAPPDEREPRPHLTIGRIGRRASDEERARAMAWMATIAPRQEPLVAAEVALYTASEDRPTRRFRIVDRRALGMR
jgi:2'-5' RNA ligase